MAIVESAKKSGPTHPRVEPPSCNVKPNQPRFKSGNPVFSLSVTT